MARSSRRPRSISPLSRLVRKFRRGLSKKKRKKRKKKGRIPGVTRENAITTLRPMFKRRLYISCNGSGKNYVSLQSKDAMFRENDVSSRNRRMQHDSQEIEITSGKNALVSREIGCSFDAILLPFSPFSTRLFSSLSSSLSLFSFFFFFFFLYRIQRVIASCYDTYVHEIAHEE